MCDTAMHWDVPGTDKAAFLSTINSSVVSYRVGLWYSHLATVIVWLDCQVNVGVVLIQNIKHSANCIYKNRLLFSFAAHWELVTSVELLQHCLSLEH